MAHWKRKKGSWESVGGLSLEKAKVKVGGVYSKKLTHLFPLRAPYTPSDLRDRQDQVDCPHLGYSALAAHCLESFENVRVPGRHCDMVWPLGLSNQGGKPLIQLKLLFNDHNNSHPDFKLNKAASPRIQTSEANPSLGLSRSRWQPEGGALGNVWKERKIKIGVWGDRKEALQIAKIASKTF